jgi:16S rRNA (guanine(1405)-N(7))-methyltransferase
MRTELDDLADKILAAPKYRGIGIPRETILDLLEDADRNGLTGKRALKAARKKLHNIIAPYLGDPDYPAAQAALTAAFNAGDEDAVQAACLGLLKMHASTRERVSLLGAFYTRLFGLTGVPRVVLDLACGLHPLSFPWMGLGTSTAYHAYDIHQPRIELLNHYFSLQGLPQAARLQDILVDPPAIKADIAFFFKEAHRFEKRRRGCNLPMWRALDVHWLLVSLPSHSLKGADLEDQHRRLVAEIIAGENWPMTEITFENEIVFCVEIGQA